VRHGGVVRNIKAPRGQPDGAARVLQTMVSSVRPSLKWYAGYQYVFAGFDPNAGSAVERRLLHTAR
jgi:hypothetical protein